MSSQRPFTTSRRTFIRVVGGAGLAAAFADALALPATAHADSSTAANPTPGSGGIPDGPSTWGWDAPDLLAFDPSTSPWARNLRCTIPRAKRIDAFAPTQAHRDLDPSTQLSMLDVDYAGSVYEARNQPIGRQEYVYTERFWPYIDVWGSWHGQVLPTVTSEQITSGTGKVYAVIDLPNPSYVEAAHKSGARCIGGWFWPRETDFSSFLVQRADGSFPVADKIVQIKKYFGFDGLFINQEATITADQVKLLFAMFDYIKKIDPDFYLQYYDAVLRDSGDLDYQNQLDAKNVSDLGAPGRQSVDAIFINYDWPFVDPGLKNSAQVASQAGFDPRAVMFAGVEMQQGGFNPKEDFGTIAGPGKTPTSSVGLFVQDQYWGTAATNGDVFSVAGRKKYRDLQTYMWSGPKGNPAQSGRLQKNPSPPRTNTLFYQGFDGIANWITERSPHSTLPITNSFNIGVGSRFNVAGATVGNAPWNNAGIADVPLTWQFWTEGGDIAVDLDETDAWEGGHCLSVDGRGILHCYKTDLRPEGEFLASVRAKGRLGIEMGLTFRDAPDAIEWHPMHPASSSAGWVEHRTTIQARGRARRRIARISLRLAGSGKLGRIALLDTDRAHRKPAGVRRFAASDAGASTGAAGLRNVSFTWQAAPDAWLYDVYQVLRRGRRRWLGRAHRDAFFAGQVDLNEGRTFLLVPTSAEGVAGAASMTRLR